MASITEKAISRRQFLKISGILGVALVGGGGTALLIAEETKRRDNKNQQESPNQGEGKESGESSLNKIKRFIELKGDNPVEFEEAVELVPVISDFLVEIEKSPRIPKELADKVYILRSSDRSQFLKDYPAAFLPGVLPKETFDLLPIMSMHKNAWVDSEGNIFVNLSVSNYIPEEPEGKVSRGLQYFGEGPVLECQKLRPVIKFISVVIHEMIHCEGGDLWKPLDQELLESWKRVRFFSPHLDEPAEKKNFIVRFGAHDIYNEFNELSTDYRVAKICIEGGLPYFLRYPVPVDVYNLGVVLKVAGISYEEFRDMYRTSNIVGFLEKFAKGACVEFSSREELLDFGVRRLYISADEKKRSAILSGKPVDTNISFFGFGKFFPGIDEGKYQYDLRNTLPSDNVKSGCI